MKENKQLIAFTGRPSLKVQLDKLGARTGRSRSQVIAHILEQTVPALLQRKSGSMHSQNELLQIDI